MAEIEITINHPAGLHARPAAVFVRTASTFKCNIRIQNLTSGKGPVNAKSILSVLTLGVNQGNTVQVQAEGDDEQAALQALQDLVDSNFGENPA